MNNNTTNKNKKVNNFIGTVHGPNSRRIVVISTHIMFKKV